MKFEYVVDSPDEIIKVIPDYNPYVIKFKCICCTETSFIKYENLIVTENKLKIGIRSYPIKLIEKITIRYKDQELNRTVEIQFKVSSRYFVQFLNDDAKESLLEFISDE